MITTTTIIIFIIIIIIFQEGLFMGNMLSCTEQMQIQNYKTHAHKTPKTACVQTITIQLQHTKDLTLTKTVVE